MLSLARPLILFYLFVLSALFTSRAGLSVWQQERLLNEPDWWLTFLGGLRIDVATCAYLVAIPGLIWILVPSSSRAGRLSRPLVKGLLLLLWGFVAFMELATPPFIDEYSLRPNRVFIEYLAYPHEVAAMLWEGYKLTLAATLIGLALALWLGRKVIRHLFTAQSPVSWSQRLGLALVFLLAGTMAARSTLGHRPLNPAMVAYASDPLVNDLTLNSAYSVLFALKNMGSEKGASELYGKMPDDEVIRLVRASSGLDSTIMDPSQPTLHKFEPSDLPVRAKNVVILLQESLGARFVGKLGGQNLTPNLDSWMERGWNFTRFYATGTRSVRGIEAVTTGFSPSPSQAVVKLSKSQNGFFSIASLLQNRGYHTQFVYGGESHFDNMKSFFLGNGFEEIHDLAKFKEPVFIGSWGASDEDLYREAHQRFTALKQEGKPFFSLVFTSTNHSPFEFPDGRIPVEGEKQTRENAIRYSDWALGEFLTQARQSDYWTDTVFWVVADHDARVYENTLMPIESFRIPSVLMGGPIEAREDGRLAGSMDVLPTLLSLLGIGAEIPVIGNDLTRDLPQERLRALMQFDQNFGYLKPDRLLVVQPEKDPLAFEINGLRVGYQKPPTQEESAIAHAHALWADLAYRKQLYRSAAPSSSQ